MVSTHPVCTATISRFNSHLGEWGWEVGSWTWEEMVPWQPCYSRWPWTKGRMQNCCRQSVLYAFQCLLVPCSNFFFWCFEPRFFLLLLKQLLKLVDIFQHSFDNVSSCIIPVFLSRFTGCICVLLSTPQLYGPWEKSTLAYGVHILETSEI